MMIYELPAAPGPDGPKSMLRFMIQEEAFDRLLNHAGEDCRLYELWSLQQPGDAWRYLEVTLVSPFTELSDWLPKSASEKDREIGQRLSAGLPVFFQEFDSLFQDISEDENNAAWLWEA